MLEQILCRTREDVAIRKRLKPLATLSRDVEPARRSLRRALSNGHTALIMECKHRSPSGGVLRADYDPVSLARCYADVADAISVLVDEPFFGGSLSDLTAVSSAVDLPVLAKGFVVDPYQVAEARFWGADAVLLIVAALDRATLGECIRSAAALGMDALVEVRDEDELTMALEVGAPAIGINARNLCTLEVDLSVSARLAALLPAGGPPVIAESGIRGHCDVVGLRPLVDGFLVGSSLVQRPDVARAARELAHGRLKVCGLTRPEDAATAWRAGASHGGLVFAPGSPRRIDPAQAREVRAAAPLSWVGVFVDESPAAVASVAADLDLDAVQLHGTETVGSIGELRRLLPAGCALWKAMPGLEPLATRASTGADRVVLDGRQPGSGRRFDWRLLPGYLELREVVVAGGITPDNAAEADRLVAWALDVGSGVETSPGIKSVDRLRALCAALRGVGRS